MHTACNVDCLCCAQCAALAKGRSRAAGRARSRPRPERRARPSYVAGPASASISSAASSCAWSSQAASAGSPTRSSRALGGTPWPPSVASGARSGARRLMQRTSSYAGPDATAAVPRGTRPRRATGEPRAPSPRCARSASLPSPLLCFNLGRINMTLARTIAHCSCAPPHALVVGARHTHQNGVRVAVIARSTPRVSSLLGSLCSHVPPTDQGAMAAAFLSEMA